MKTTWSPNQTKLQDQTLRRRLTRAGIAFVENAPAQTPMLKIEPVGGPYESILMVTARRGCVIAVWVRIVALVSGLNIANCEIGVRGWDDDQLCLVGRRDRPPFYRNIANLEYCVEDVLNDRFGDEHLMRRGEIFEGVLLFESFKSPPGWFLHGMMAGCELCFEDQFENLHLLPIELWVVRDDRLVGAGKGRPFVTTATNQGRLGR